MATRPMPAGRSSAMRQAAPRMAEARLAGSPFEQKPIGDVWGLYQRSGDDEIRNYLTQKYLHVVRRSAERLHKTLPDLVDVEDLASAGNIGLMEAVAAYDMERRVKFETFCALRIRGAMLDELRGMDWTPRLARMRAAMVERARRRIAQELGRPATREEIIAILGVSEAEFDRIERDSRIVAITSLTQPSRDDGGQQTREIDIARDEDADNPLRQAQRKDLQDLITRGLSRAERLIVILYYYEGLTMKEIGATLALSESRVSQMHTSIVRRLRVQMKRRAAELEPSR